MWRRCLHACKTRGFFWVLGALVIVALPLAMTVQQVQRANALGAVLSEEADSYGEADTVRAADGWIHRGFGFTRGLPEIGYGDRYALQGGKNDPELCKGGPTCVYLHNPPGSAYVVWLGFKIFGPNDIVRTRYLPIALFGVSTWVFLAALARRFGAQRAGIVAAVLYATPMFSNMAHGLCYHGESLSMLLLLWASLLSRAMVGRLRLAIPLAALCSFLLGWLAYENVFVCILSPLAFAFANGWRRRTTAYAFAACCFGFGLAQVLHILQVAAFMGSLGAALHDLAAAGHKRIAERDRGTTDPLSAPELFRDYIFKHAPKREYFHAPLAPLYLATLCLCFVRARIPRTRWSWRPARGASVSLACALLGSLAWIAIMRQHATIHFHFLPRMFILPVMVMILIAVHALRRRQKAAVVAAPQVATPPG